MSLNYKCNLNKKGHLINQCFTIYNFNILNAVPKYVSKITSYIHVRLAFHHYSQII